MMNRSQKPQLQPLDTTLDSPSNITTTNGGAEGAGELDDSSSFGSNDIEKSNFIQYFTEPRTEKSKFTNPLKRFSSNQRLRLSFDEKQLPPGTGLLRRQASSSSLKTPSHSHSRRLSWMSAMTYDLSEPLLNILNLNSSIGEKFKLLLKPPKFDRDDLLFSIHTFMSSIIDYIPAVKLDKTYQIFKDVRDLLKLSECIRLFGLLIHYCYWNIIHPTARDAMKEIKFTHQRHQSFSDIDLTGNSYQVFAQQNRVGLLPEILDEGEEDAEGGKSNFKYDEENISPKNRSYSFRIIAQVAQGNPISPSMFARNIKRDSMMSAITDSSDTSVNGGRGGGSGAKTMKQIDDMFNQQLENIGEENDVEEDDGEGSIGSGTIASKMSSVNSKEVAIHQDEQMTNIPFTPSNRRKLTISTDLNNIATGISNTNPNSMNSHAVPWLTEGSVGGMSLSSETSLTFHEREQLFIQLETCITSLFRKMGRGKFALVTGRQALISCCHYIVDDILTAMYPWFAQVKEEYRPPSKGKRKQSTDDDGLNPLQKSLKELNLRLRRLVHQSISDLIDPSRIYTSSMLLNLVLGLGTAKTIKQATRKAKELLENEHHGGRRGKYFRTSAAVLALFGDSHSPLARKFLQRSATLYTSIPGAVEPFLSKLDNVGEWDEPLEYLKTIQDKEEKEKIEKELLKITDKDVEISEIKRIAKEIASNGLPSPVHGKNGGKLSPMASPSRAVAFHGESLMESISRNTSRGTSRQNQPKSHQRIDEEKTHQPTHREKPVRKPLDFMNLFKSQPEADYYPRIGTSNKSHPHHLGMLSPNRPRSRTVSPIATALKNNSPNASPNRIQALNNTVGTDVNHGRTKSPDRSNKRFIHRKTKKNLHTIHNSLFFSDRTASTTNSGSNDPFGRFGGGAPINRTISNTAVGFLHNEESLTVHSSSIESDSAVSLANNAYAELPISLNAKTALMNLMVSKTSSLYASKMQTNQTRQRIALLQGDKISFSTASTTLSSKDNRNSRKILREQSSSVSLYS